MMVAARNYMILPVVTVHDTCTANDTGEQLHKESLMTGTWDSTASPSHHVKEYNTAGRH